MMNQQTSKLPIAVLISGGGSTLLNLCRYIADGKLDVEIKLVISSSSKAGGLQYAQRYGIAQHVVRPRESATPKEFSDRVFDLVRSHNIDLVVMGGFLSHILIPIDYQSRVINIHPSLIPAFSGQGFYGLSVHKAALQYGVKLSGCTVHFVDNEYDHGPIIAQSACEVLPDDAPESLQARVGELERLLLPSVLQAIAEGRIEVNSETRSVRVKARTLR